MTQIMAQHGPSNKYSYFLKPCVWCIGINYISLLSVISAVCGGTKENPDMCKSEIMGKYIETFEIKGLWRKYNLVWNKIREDVNIVVGINGSGKTTLIDNINDFYTNKKSNRLYKTAKGNALESPLTYIQSFDVPADGKKKSSRSPLLDKLLAVVMQNTSRTSLTNYRLIPVNYPSETERVTRRVNEFFKVVDDFFSETGKKIDIDKSNNMPVFEMETGDVIQLHELSAGEKQMLLILLNVFLMDEKPSVLLMDEPELSLHITWQEKLLRTLRKLNPQCQIIISTHSPSIFLDGWRENIVFVEDLIKPVDDGTGR